MNIRPSITALAVASVFSSAASFALASDKDQPTVVVTATRQASPLNELLSDVTVIERDAIEQAGQSTLSELLGRQPGIQFAQNGGPGKAASIYMRGTNTGHTLILIDGMRIGSASLGSPSPENLPLSQIERIEILRGPASALYGSDAVGGVIQIFTRSGEQGAPRIDAFAGVGSYATREVSAGVSGGNTQWSYSARGGYTESDGFSSRKGADPDKDGYRSSNFSGSLAFRPQQGHEIGVNALLNEQRSWFDDQYSAAKGDIFGISRVSTYGIYSRNTLTSRWTSTMRLSRSEDDSFQRFSLTNPTSNFQTNQNQFLWQNDIVLPLGQMLLGYERLSQNLKTSKDYAETKRNVDSLLAGWTASAGRHQWQLNARHDDNSDFGGKTTGTASYGFQFTPSLRASAAYGTSFKAPSFNALYYPYSSSVYSGVTYITQGNPDAKPEEGRNREVALHWSQGGSAASATYYNNHVSNLIDWQTIRVGNVSTLQPNNVSSAKLEGLTLTGQTRYQAWKFSATADFLNAKDESTGFDLQRRAHRTGVLRAERGVGSVDVGTELIGTGGRYTEARNGKYAGGYALVNAYARWSMARDWSLEGRVNNLLDKRYELVQGYNTPGANVFVGIRYAPR